MNNQNNISNYNMLSTAEYIKAHIDRVRKHLNIFIKLLESRAINHDASKLGPTELPLWEKMDQEPRYRYGTPEYKDKIRRYKAVSEYHYAHNRHHPEHYPNGIADMTLIDIMEMVADWLGYKDDLSYNDAIKIVADQMLKYNIINEDEYKATLDPNYSFDKKDPNILKLILINTLRRYFVVLKGLKGEPDGIVEELHPHDNPYFRNLYDKTIDIYI